MRKTPKILAAMVLLSAPTIRAQEDAAAAPISLEIRAEKEAVRIEPDGRRTIELVEAEKVLPGTTVVYTITYTNSGDKPAGNVVINNPMPEEVMYLEGSAVGEGTQIDYSVDGETYGLPVELVVPVSDGTTRPAEPGDYRYVRWKLNEPVPANGSGFVRYRAVLR